MRQFVGFYATVHDLIKYLINYLAEHIPWILERVLGACILPYPQIQPLGADSSRCVPSLQGLGIRFLLSDECRMGYFYTRIFWIGKIGASQVISGTHNLQGAILCNYYLMVIGASR